ncbi:23331_t:CDS:2, partial [Dentiscutata erythropus]
MEDVLIGPFDEESQELPLTRATKRRRTEEGREEQPSNGEEPLSTRKRKQDRVLDYLKKIDKEVGDLRKEKIVGEIASKSIENIYPNDDTLKATATSYLIKKYSELFEGWKNSHWTFYYDLILKGR